ncbi:hypothetical protein [Tardiphaga sp. P9-11]|uniref:hypothetical protein n=1 Tax=Tardiphaga sp. P9-11 TaxID=2024614 RepID=UPI0011F0D8C0|nr:hypothetical protein [Tardiphaga sp. P9-11]
MTFPESAERTRLDLKAFVKSIECELAAAALSPAGRKRHLKAWNVLTDLNITLERSVSADGVVTVGVPVGPGGLGVTPKIGGTDTDMRINTLKFATSVTTAVDHYGNDCSGDDPSETNMGLSNWIQGTLAAIDADDLVTISFTKQFNIVVNGGVRFGYTLVPVTNTIDTAAGFSTYRDYTNRFTIALTPPAEPAKPLKVAVTNWPKSVTMAPAITTDPVPGGGKPGGTTFFLNRTPNPPVLVIDQDRRGGRSSSGRRLDTPRNRVLQDPIIRNEINSKSPIFLQQ